MSHAHRPRLVAVPRADILDVTVTYLTMDRRPNRPAPVRPSPEVRVVRATRPTIAYYRWLYDGVGAPWLWYERKRMTDRELGEILADPGTHIWVLSVGHVPAGFFELDTREIPGVTNLAYFGLMPDFVGQGLGRFFLECAVTAAWATNPRRVTVNTCTFDHPRALPLYRSVGFELVERQHRRIIDPRTDWRSRRRRPLAADAQAASGSGSG